MRGKKKSQRGKRRMAKRRKAALRKSERKGGRPGTVPETGNLCDGAAVAQTAAANAAGGRRLDFRHVPLGRDGLAAYMPDLAAGPYAEIDFHRELNAARDPLAVLGRARQWLAPGGTVRASFVNARNVARIGALISGKWSKEVIGHSSLVVGDDQGQRTSDQGQSTEAPRQRPIRFFTRREIEKLFYRAGYELRELRPEPNAALDAWRRAGCPAEVAAGSLKIATLSPEEAEEFLAESFLAVAEGRDCGSRIADCGSNGGGREEGRRGRGEAERRGDAEMGRRGGGAAERPGRRTHAERGYEAGTHEHHRRHAQRAGLHPDVPGERAVLHRRALRADRGR